MKLNNATNGRTAVCELAGSLNDTKLSLAAEHFSEVIKTYKASPTAFRLERIKQHGHKSLFGFSPEACLEAIDSELLATEGCVDSSKWRAALSKAVKKAVWRMANLSEAQRVFSLFKNNPNAALKHIREQFAAEYSRTAKYILERNGYDLTPQDYACTIWIHLSARGTWKAFDSFKGDSSVYAWLKEVCKHCINDYVEGCGYYSLLKPAADEVAEAESDGVNGFIGRSTKRLVYFEDYEQMQVADSRSSYESDFITDAPSFLTDRIDEMPWLPWEKEFITDSVINEMSATDLTEKYGAMVALMQGKAMPFNRAWTDNRNSRMKRDLYEYALAYMNNDGKVLSFYAKKMRDFERQQAKGAVRKTA